MSRTVSLYNYERMAWGTYENIKNPNDYQKKFRKRITDHFLIDGKVPDFETWLHRVYNHHHIFYATMTNYLEYLNFIDDKRDESSLQDALQKFYFVGITESFSTDADYLYHLFNVKTSMGHENVSPGFINKSALSKDILNQIKDVNRDDMVLYECALRENALFKKNTQDFYVKVSETNRRRKCHFAMEWTKKTLKDMLRPWFKPLLEMYRSRR